MDASQRYSEVIEQQKKEGIIESRHRVINSKGILCTHKPLVGIKPESTKLRVVCDASSQANPQAPSSNNYLYAGPPLQNKL